MKIRLESRGGVHGRPMVRQMVVDGLNAEARNLRRMLDDGRFWNGPETLLATAPKAWDFEHKLTVEDGGKTRTVRMHTAAAPAALQKLVRRMEELPTGS
jgi:hypothetical protein